MSEKVSTKTPKEQKLLEKVPSKPMTLGDWRRWWLKVDDSDVVDAFNVKLIAVEGLAAALQKRKKSWIDGKKEFEKQLKEISDLSDSKQFEGAEAFLSLFLQYQTRISELDWFLAKLDVKEQKKETKQA